MIWGILENVVLSALHGWAGATLAVYMFFYPLRPWRIGNVIIWHGLIPRYQDKIAAAIGTVVGRDLLTKEAVADYIAANPDFTLLIRTQVKNVLAEIMAQDYGTVGDVLSQAVPGGHARLLAAVRDSLVRRVQNFLQEREFAAGVFDMACETINDGHCQLGEVLPAPLLAQLLASVGMWLKDYFASPAGEETVRQGLEEVHAALVRETRSVREVIPLLLCDALYALPAAAARTVPALLRQLEQNGRLDEYITFLVELLLRRMRHTGTMAGLLLRNSQVAAALRRTLTEIIKEDVWPRLVGAAASERGQLFLIRQGEQAVDGLLHTPVAQLAARWDQPARQALHRWLVDGLRALWRSEAMGVWWERESRYLAVELAQAVWPSELLTAEAQRWRESFIQAVQQFASTGRTQRILAMAADRFLNWLLAQPVTKIKNLLPDKYNAAIFVSMVNGLTELIGSNMARMVETANVSAIIAREIGAFSPERLVRLFKDVTLNSLSKIELWGAVIGAVLGFFFGLANAMPGFFWSVAAALLAGTLIIKLSKH